MQHTSHAPLVLALDIGSSSTRCLAYDSAGEPVPGLIASRAYQAHATADGGSELEPAALLENALGCLQSLAGQAQARGAPILGVGVCTFWHATLGLDEQDGPQTPVLMWNDLRAAAQAQALQRCLDGPAVRRRTGCVLHPSYLPARLLWLREAQPEVFARCRRFVSPGEWLELRLFGRRRVGLSMAAGTGLLDQERLDWDGELLRAIGVSADQLSPLEREHRALQGLLPEAAARLPGLAQVPFFPAVGDGACSNLGSGATQPQVAALMVGTSAAVRRFYPQGVPPAPPGLWRYLLDPRRGVLGGALSNGGNLHAWLTATLRLPPPAQQEAHLAGAAPGAHGLEMLPFLAGERNPDYPLRATGVLAGLRLATRPLDILHASLEAVAFRLADLAERLRAAPGPAMTGFLASGGMLQSPMWVRLLADVLGLPVTQSSVAEASSRGAALLALEGLGLLPSLQALPTPTGATYQPDPERHARYRELRARHEALYARHVQEWN